MTLQQFAWFSLFEKSYIKPETVDGAPMYAVHAADGSLLFRVASREAARMLAREFMVETLPLH